MMHKAMNNTDFFQGLEQTVAAALAEDLGSGDITAELVPATQRAQARLICREAAVLCGRPWADEVFRQVDTDIQLEWHVGEGEALSDGCVVFTLQGPAPAVLSAERTALNFLQTLSGTATLASEYAALVKNTGLRLAQKYAVLTGGCHNHRIGLYDAYLIKENHIAAAGGIADVIRTARQLHADRPVEIEVETLAQLQLALDAGADIVMLDNFSLEQLREAVALTAGRTILEASGGYAREDLAAVAATGVDCISIGALTKHLRATDFSLRFL